MGVKKDHCMRSFHVNRHYLGIAYSRYASSLEIADLIARERHDITVRITDQ